VHPAPAALRSARETAADRVADAWDNGDDFWRSVAMRALRWLASLDEPFDAFELVELGVPEPDDPHRWGGLFRHARGLGLIECVGYRPSRRPTSPSAIVRLWQGVGRE